MIIRRATPDDAHGIARVHVDTWRTAYAGMMPAAYLAGLSYDQRAAFWSMALSTPNRAFTFVAEDGEGRIVGFASGGPPLPENPSFDGELLAIYVLKEEQGKGIGKALFRAVAGELRARGVRAMLLWVLKENTPSRRFYEAMGGQLLEEKEFELGGAILTEVGYGWPDINSALALTG